MTPVYPSVRGVSEEDIVYDIAILNQKITSVYDFIKHLRIINNNVTNEDIRNNGSRMQKPLLRCTKIDHTKQKMAG